MPCTPFNLGNGVTGIVCTRGGNRSLCTVPGCNRPSSKLCDYPVKRGGVAGTCDAKLCSVHATSVGPNKDYCLTHVKLEKELR